MPKQIGRVTDRYLLEGFRNLKGALNEATQNAAALFEGENTELIREYLEGDAAEIERQSAILAQNLRHIVSESEKEED